MREPRSTVLQIVATVREADAGMKVKEICHQHGISNATYYKWRSKYGGAKAAGLRPRTPSSKRCMPTWRS